MATQQNAPLPEGLLLGGYRIVKKIASGGFSIVYLAYDADGYPVAIKEYLPASLARRKEGEFVPVVDAANLPTYRNGLKCFFEEGRALARILHPNVVRVVNFFRANETVYMVMNYESGRSLQEHILRHRQREKERGRATRQPILSERFIRRVFAQITHGLREVHTNKLLHLDLKPANIYLRVDGSPLLLDFGAARQTLTSNAPKLYPMYTPGFAGPELYKRQGQLGPWTDIYAIGASMFACMIGSPPQAADLRLQEDRVRAQLRALEALYSRELISLVDWCLRLDALERPQSVFALQKALLEKVPPKKELSLPQKILERVMDLTGLGGKPRARSTRRPSARPAVARPEGQGVAGAPGGGAVAGQVAGGKPVTRPGKAGGGAAAMADTGRG